MPQGKSGYGYQQYWIDWYYVTYKRLLVIFVVILALLAYPGYLVYQKYFQLPPEQRQAQEAIRTAEQLYDRAVRIELTPVLSEYLNHAAAKLGESREAWEATRYDLAYLRAVESKTYSTEILDSAETGRTRHGFMILDVEGGTQIKRKNSLQWEDAARDMQLEPGDKLQTGDRGSARLFSFDGSVYVAKPNSLIEIQKSLFNPLTREKSIEVNVNFGFLDLSTSSRSADGSTSKVTTSNTVSQVAENSRTAINYDEKSGKTTVLVYQGDVLLSSGREQKKVGSNQRVTATPGKGLSSAEELPLPPKLVSPPHLRRIFFDRGSNSTVQLEWHAGEPGCRYHVQIARHPLFTDPVVDQTDLTEDAITVKNLAVGEYYWRVRSITGSMVEGEFSRPQKFITMHEKSVPGQANRPPPRLDVEQPLVFGNYALVQGKTDPGIFLTINDDEADVESDGTFRHLITLPDEGINLIRVMAQDPSGLKSKLDYRVDVALQ